jgi:hypothetical protein
MVSAARAGGDAIAGVERMAMIENREQTSVLAGKLYKWHVCGRFARDQVPILRLSN